MAAASAVDPTCRSPMVARKWSPSSAARRIAASCSVMPAILQPGDQAPVDRDELAGDVRRALGGQEGDEGTQLLRAAVSARRDGSDVRGTHLVLGPPLALRPSRVELVDARRGDPPGHDAV